MNCSTNSGTLPHLGQALRGGVQALGCVLALWTVCVLGAPACAAPLPPLPEAIWDQLMLRAPMASGKPQAPGRLPANATSAVRSLFFSPSAVRHVSYEIIFPQQRTLALVVFSLALHAGDVPKDTNPQRFFKGAQGFHYTIEQICAWRMAMPDCLDNLPPEAAAAALWLARLLEEDQVIRKEAGGWQGTGVIGHVLGAARSEKRTLARNLMHERLHVLWDENTTMREEARNAWEALTPAQQEKALQALKGYAGDPDLLLEEWAVRRLE